MSTHISRPEPVTMYRMEFAFGPLLQTESCTFCGGNAAGGESGDIGTPDEADFVTVCPTCLSTLYGLGEQQ